MFFKEKLTQECKGKLEDRQGERKAVVLGMREGRRLLLLWQLSNEEESKANIHREPCTHSDRTAKRKGHTAQSLGVALVSGNNNV